MARSGDRVSTGPGPAGISPLLGGFIALDLTAGHNRIGGSMLAHFGMRVLRPCRAAADELNCPEDWFENSGKELWQVEDPAAFLRLVSQIDAVLMDETTHSLWGVAAEDLVRLNPGAIVTVISPFGAAGPLAGKLASELTLQASAGAMWLVGYPERPPVPIAGSQSGYHAATQAVLGLLIALYGREQGISEGELVDVSAQEAMCNASVMTKAWWYIAGLNLLRSETNTIGGQTHVQIVWPASDGFICWRITLGLGDADARMRAMVEWMVDDARIGEELREVAWGSISTVTVTLDEIQAWETTFARFFQSRTRAELFAGARERDILLLPVLSLDEVLLNEHVVARGCFNHVALHDTAFSVPAFPIRGDGIRHRRIAPTVIKNAPSLPSQRQVAPRLATGGAPLDGVKILDFGWAVAGPVTTHVLGLMGATVVKIESNTRLDPTRASTPFSGRPSRDRSGYFSAHNGSKLSLTLDLNRPGSRDVLQRLVCWADVLTENFSAGRLEQWDLGTPILHGWNSTLIVLRSSTWGQTGPYRSIGTNGVVLGGFTGFGYLNGWPDRPPLASVEPYTDMISPWFAASAVVAALLARRSTGIGQTLDVAQLECALNFLGPEFARASAGETVTRAGPFTCDPYPAGVFKAPGIEEWCALSVLNAEQWQALCRIVPGMAGVAAASVDAWKPLVPYIFSALAAFFLSQPADSAARLLLHARVPAAKVARPEDVWNDPQLNFRGHFSELPHPSMGRYAYERPSFRYQHHAIVPRRSPLIGEHNWRVMSDFLGYTEDEIADIYAEGILN